MWTHDACGCMAHVEIHRQAHTHGHRPAGLSSVLLPSQAHATRQGGGGPAWKPNKLDPVVPLFFGIFIYILVRLLGLIVSARCSHFGVFPQEAGSEETSLLPQLPPRADCSGWGRGPPIRGPLTPMCIVTQLLHSLPWRFPVFVLCRRKNMGVPWRTGGQDLALSVAQVQSLVQELRPRQRCGSARRRRQQHVQVRALFLSVKGGWRVRQHSVVTDPVRAANCSICVSWGRSVKCGATAVRSVKFFLPKGISRCCRVSLCWRWA